MEHVKPQRQSLQIPPPTDEDNRALYATLSATGTRCGILAFVEPYSSQYVPRMASENCPKSLDCLYDDTLASLDYKALLDQCDRRALHLQLTAQQVDILPFTSHKNIQVSVPYQIIPDLSLTSLGIHLNCTNF